MLNRYKSNPNINLNAVVEQEFDSLFTRTTGYIELDKRIALTFKNRKSYSQFLNLPRSHFTIMDQRSLFAKEYLKGRSAMEQDPI